MSNPDITIPREVVEAMARNRAIRNEDDDRYWPDYADGVEADIRAGLKAWPNATRDPAFESGGMRFTEALILPVTQEAGDE